MPIRTILVRATNWIGDAVMCLPALQQLRIAYPDAHIAILARPWVAGLYGREPFCNELIPYEAPKGWSGLGGKWRLATQLRKRRFDCAVLLQNAFEAAALTWVANIPIRIGYDRDARGWLLSHPVAVPKSGEIPRHQRFYYLELLKRSGLIRSYPQESIIRLSGAGEAALAGRLQLSSAGLEGAVIGVSPGAAYGGAKRWLPERFAEAATTIAREHNAAVAIFGSEAERAICEIVCGLVVAGGCAARNFAGTIALDRFIEVAGACRLFITNDSGPMHIASALGVPTVAVFGATDDVATGPTGNWSRVVRHPVECSPCLLRECPIDHRCMTRVKASDVAQQALNLLSAAESAKR